jgi:hypothetical protein
MLLGAHISLMRPLYHHDFSIDKSEFFLNFNFHLIDMQN